MPDCRITFTDTDKSRRTIRLGKLNKRETELVESRVRLLLACKFSGEPAPPDVATWLNRTSDYIREKLVGAGLIAARQSMTLGEWMDAFFEKRIDLKASSVTVYRRCETRLVEFFGNVGFAEFEKSDSPWKLLGPDRVKKHFGDERFNRIRGRSTAAIIHELGRDAIAEFLGLNKELRSITREDAADWRRFAATVFPSENTVRRMTGVARQFFTAAQRHRLIDDNPFAGLAACVRENPDRFHFVTPKDAAAVILACPNAEWRLLFALARWGGLRVPSEPLALRWSDVDWERNRLTVHSPKTEHHEGGESRVIPIFPELRPHLEAAFDEAPEGTEFVIRRHRDPACNLRTQLMRIIARAGLTPWPKLWHNLRSTRQTELAAEYPIHVVCKWIGNSAAVAQRHYLQLLDDHYERASRPASQHTPELVGTVVNSPSLETTNG